MFHEPRRRTRATRLQASSSDSSTWTRARYPLVCFCVVCCVILASVAVFFGFPASATAGPDLDFRFFQSTIWEDQYCIYTRSTASRQRNWWINFSAFSVFFISSCHPTGSARLEGGKIPRVGSHTWRLVYFGTVCWLASRRTMTISNRRGEHTGMRVAALLPVDFGLGRGG